MIQKMIAPKIGSRLSKNLGRGKNAITKYSFGILEQLLAAATRGIMGTITHVVTQDSVVALTFDDGPHPEYTPRLLDLLDRHHAQGTFFMVGEFAKHHPELVREVARRGHAIGNHSWNHPSFPIITSRERREQIRACEGAVAPYGARLFRPPYGHQSIASCIDVLRSGYEIITWSVSADDWRPHEPIWMADRLCSRIQPGSIVILHEVIRRSVQSVPQYDRQSMLAAVDITLQRLRDRFKFVTVPELLRHGHPKRQHWYQTPDAEILPRLREHLVAAGTFAAAKKPDVE
jgi:peptidoglycan-N-acetylglucosamine deacetylase